MARSGKEEKVSKKSKRPKKDTLEKRIDDFGEEVEELGDRFGRKAEKLSEEKRTWLHKTFGILGPLFSSILGLIFLAAFIWLLEAAYNITREAMILGIKAFLSEHMGLIFALFLFFSYSSYFAWAYPRAYRPFSPVVTAASIYVGLWFALQVINVILSHENIEVLGLIAAPLEANLNMIFWAVLLVGYIFYFFGGPGSSERLPKVQAKSPRNKEFKKSKIQRIYRSGQDKVLGGVCGGIANYLGVDPVLIRVILIVAFFINPSVLIAYIIAWIIVPRNPEDEWA
jgi:phage shock protein PspC (stress-responsive transcriptional regulator)